MLGSPTAHIQTRSLQDNLPEYMKETASLYLIEKLPLDIIAKHLNCPTGTIRSRTFSFCRKCEMSAFSYNWKSQVGTENFPIGISRWRWEGIFAHTTLIFHFFIIRRTKCYGWQVIRSVSGVLHIWAKAKMLHSGIKWSCFIWKGGFVKRTSGA